MYRLVSDFGYGDKAWVERWLTADEMLDALRERGLVGEDITIGQALDLKFSGDTYYIEYDDGCGEDWDWMDS